MAELTLREKWARKIHAKIPFDVCHPEDWEALKPDARQAYLDFVEIELLSDARTEIEKKRLTNRQIIDCQYGNKTCDDNSMRIAQAQYDAILKVLG